MGPGSDAGAWSDGDGAGAVVGLGGVGRGRPGAAADGRANRAAKPATNAAVARLRAFEGVRIVSFQRQRHLGAFCWQIRGKDREAPKFRHSGRRFPGRDSWSQGKRAAGLRLARMTLTVVTRPPDTTEGASYSRRRCR